MTMLRFIATAADVIGLFAIPAGVLFIAHGLGY
jgi:hypothetical protein